MRALEGNLIDTLVSPDPEIEAQFGWRVLTDGEIVFVADVEHTANGFTKAGLVHIFEWGEQAAEQPPAENGTTESEPEQESEESGGIPGFPVESILVSLATVITALWLTQRAHSHSDEENHFAHLLSDQTHTSLEPIWKTTA